MNNSTQLNDLLNHAAHKANCYFESPTSYQEVSILSLIIIGALTYVAMLHEGYI
jgi:hypothetical protein